jgi:hypothetical protein
MHSSAAPLACSVQETARVIIKTAGKKSLVRSGICSSTDVDREPQWWAARQDCRPFRILRRRKMQVRSRSTNVTGSRCWHDDSPCCCFATGNTKSVVYCGQIERNLDCCRKPTGSGSQTDLIAVENRPRFVMDGGRGRRRIVLLKCDRNGFCGKCGILLGTYQMR